MRRPIPSCDTIDQTVRDFVGGGGDRNGWVVVVRSSAVKVLTLTDLFPPSVGGMELHIIEVARQRRHEGIDVTVVTMTQDATSDAALEADGIKIYRIAGGFSRAKALWRDPKRTFHPPFPDPVVSRQLRRILEIEQPDAVHAHNWMIYSYLAIKRPSDPPVLWMQHDYSLACPKKSASFFKTNLTCDGPGVMKCVACSSRHYGTAKGVVIPLGLQASNRLLMRRVDRFVANSTAVRDFMRFSGVSGQNVAIVPGFVASDLEERGLARPRPTYLPTEDGYLLYVGSTGAHKGVLDLLEAYTHLRSPAPTLVVLGVRRFDSPTMWPSNVVVVDSVPYDDVLSAMAHCSFVVVPSRWPEPFGRIVLEAASFGKTVVATKVGGLSDLVGADGLVVAPNDPSALANAMQQLIDSPETARELGARARTKVPQYSVQAMTEKLNSEITDMIRVHRGESTP